MPLIVCCYKKPPKAFIHNAPGRGGMTTRAVSVLENCAISLRDGAGAFGSQRCPVLRAGRCRKTPAGQVIIGFDLLVRVVRWGRESVGGWVGIRHGRNTEPPIAPTATRVKPRNAFPNFRLARSCRRRTELVARRGWYSRYSRYSPVRFVVHWA
ncbi:hypothetical protein N657DRAFT_673341 [Parathielavia appendiculata]|uniref:Uncharacterized protein n=1 Tax=Parathielavia appendiculata TaxID=2587402 RepID=A0AAN6TVR2_9PEZI|nr:hypothetical protein N657DRAFT_673341 [Parathielavia appendiculata]